MTAQDLKNAILQLAVQGKLVPQDPNDEPASELLKRIRAEKERLVKEGKIKKEKPLSSITDDEIPFDIPESWEWVKLGDLCVISTGKKDANFGSPNGDYYFFTCAKEPIRCDSFSFSGESILMAGNGDISNISYYVGDFEAYQRTYVVQPFIEQTYLLYLYYHLNSNWVRYNSDKTFGSAIPYIRLGNVQNYLVALPPLAEQQRIVAKIEELMPLVEEYGKAEEQLTTLNTDFPDKLRKSILQQAIQGKLTERAAADEPASELLKRIRAEKERLIKEGKIKKEKTLPPITEEEMPFEIPENWEWVRIGEVFEVNPRNSVSDDTDVGFIPMPLLEPGYVNKHTYQKRIWKDIKYNFTHFQNGDVVFAKITPCFQNRKSAIICDLPNGYGAGTTELHVLRSYSRLILNEYALWFVKNERFIVDGVEHFTGSVGQQRVGTDFIKQYPFPLPPLAEQQRIVDRVNELLALCDELN